MRLVAGIALTLVAFASQTARAGLVRVDFGGVIDSLEIGDDSEVLAGEVGASVQPGTRFSGFFTFDDAATPGPGGPSTYTFETPPSSLQTTLGAYTANAAAPGFPLPDQYDIFVLESGSGDADASAVEVKSYLRAISGPGAETLAQFVFELSLMGDAQGEPLSSSQLSDVPWDLSLFAFHTVAWSFGRPRDDGNWEYFGALGTVDTLTASPVPEPTLCALVALALAALGFRRARS